MKIFFPELSQGQLFVFLKNFTKLKKSNELPPPASRRGFSKEYFVKSQQNVRNYTQRD